MLQDYEARTGKEAKELSGPPFPKGLEHVWNWFCELDQARTGSGFGVNAISWVEIEAWARLSEIRLTVFERQALRGIDLEYLRVATEKKG